MLQLQQTRADGVTKWAEATQKIGELIVQMGSLQELTYAWSVLYDRTLLMLTGGSLAYHLLPLSGRVFRPYSPSLSWILASLSASNRMATCSTSRISRRTR
jgi:hypothetical protein